MIEALFVDRDGVIAQMVKYGQEYDSAQHVKDVLLIDGISDVISWANRKRIPVIEISNQPGVAKGKQTQTVSDAIEKQVHDLLHHKNATIDKVYICPHHPNAVVANLKQECDCRKPKPGLLQKAASEMRIDLEKSVFLGDGKVDVEAGRAVGCITILLLHKQNEPKKVLEAYETEADYKVQSLKEVVSILEQISIS